MTNWTFNPSDYNENSFTPIPTGDHRVRINDVVFKRFNSGNEGYEITLDVSGYGSKLWFYLVLNPEDPKKTNQHIGAFFDSFGITDYNMSHYAAWKGRTGAVRVKHETYNGEQQAKVAFCLSSKKQEKLPPWMNEGAATPTQDFTSPMIDESELPFS